MGQRRPWSDDHAMTPDEIARDVDSEDWAVQSNTTTPVWRCRFGCAIYEDPIRLGDLVFCSEFCVSKWRDLHGSTWW